MKRLEFRFYLRGRRVLDIKKKLKRLIKVSFIDFNKALGPFSHIFLFSCPFHYSFVPFLSVILALSFFTNIKVRVVMDLEL